MKIVKVAGRKNKHKVFLYTLSTCAWCNLTKNFLKENDVGYEYVDVDLCSEEDLEQIRMEILKRAGNIGYPTIIIDDKTCITGFDKARIKEALKI